MWGMGHGVMRDGSFGPPFPMHGAGTLQCRAEQSAGCKKRLYGDCDNSVTMPVIGWAHQKENNTASKQAEFDKKETYGGNIQ